MDDLNQQTESTPEQAPEPTASQSFEDIFTSMGEGKPVETVNEQPAPQGGQPPQPVDTPAVDNDERRFQYWQSQSDKRQNEIERLNEQNTVLQNQLNHTIQTSKQDSTVQEQEFPEPPQKPSTPHGFSRDEAMTDPGSRSAEYLNQVEAWRENMDEYNRLYTQYNVAKVQESMQDIQKQRQSELTRAAQEQQYRQKQVEAVDYIKGNFGATDVQAREFVTRYSDPKSVTMDNLWKLYQLEAGQGVSPNQPQVTPSAAFQQTQAAQQIPSPMGVVSGQSGQQTGTVEDQMMDAMVSDHKSKNYF